MRAYELILILRPTLKDEERKKLVNTVKDFLGKPEVVKEDDWGQKTLSYMIKRETAGHYFRLMLEMEGEIPSDFEKRIITHDNVLRHLFLRRNDKGLKTKDKKEEVKTPSAAKAKDDKQSSKVKVQSPKVEKVVRPKKVAKKAKK